MRAPAVLLLAALFAPTAAVSAQSLLLVQRPTLAASLLDANTGLESPAGIVPFPSPLAGLTAHGQHLYVLSGGSTSPTSVTAKLWRFAAGGAPPVLVADTGVAGSFDAVAVSPQSGEVYAVQVLLGIITTVFRVPGAGPAVAISPSPAPIGLWIEAIACAPDGIIWAARRGPSPSIGTLDSVTGTYTMVHPTVRQFSTIAFVPGTWSFYGVDAAAGQLVAVDTATGVESVLGPVALGSPWFTVELAAYPWASVPAGASIVGAGCAGTRGAPGLVANGLPILGNGAFSMQVDGAVPGATTQWFLADSASAGAASLGSGCFLHLDPGSFLAYAALQANPVFLVQADSSGTAAMPVPLPLLPLEAGRGLALQAAVPDPLAPLGFTVTPSLSLTLGF